MIPGRERPILIDDQFRKLNEILDHPNPGQYETDSTQLNDNQKKHNKPD